MQNDNNKFSYTYSAPTEAERREIESIRRQYKEENNEENKLARLKKLHSGVIGRATVVSLVFGVVGLLIFGLGMSLVLEFQMTVVGIIVSMVGVVPIILAYPIYNVIMNRGKKKYGEEILRLSKELLGEN